MNVPVDVRQRVVRTDASLVVQVEFENVSKTPVLIKEGSYGIAAKGRPSTTYPLDEPEFIITANGKPLEYVGPVAKRLPFEKRHFVYFAPSETSSVSLDISKSFRFLPGEHEYSIVHHHLEYDELSSKIIERASSAVTFTYFAK